MKKLMSHLIMGVIFSLPLLTGSTVLADEGKGWKKDREKFYQEMKAKLNLTPEQDAKMQTHRKEQRGKMKAFRKEIRSKKKALRQEVQNEVLDRAKIDQMQGELKTMQGQMLDYRLEGILGVRAILTAEQYKTFIEMKDKKKAHWKKNK